MTQHVTTGADAEKNFLVVDNKTENAAIEAAFDRFTEDRKDIGIVLINQHVRQTFIRSQRGMAANTIPDCRQDTTPH